MYIFNTLSGEKELFTPLKKGEVGMYSCGPTVYNFAHIGNLRTYIFMDLLRRALRLEGLNVQTVMNITDVGHLVSDADEGEDKMAKASKEQQKTPLEIADFYTKVFFDDIASLNIGRPELVPKATEHIEDMIVFVQGLLEKGFAYETSDGIYFDILKFGNYGKLSGLKLEDQIAGARVEVNEEKHHPADFALWKKASPEHIMQWASPWGMGYPGWHIECSAMSRRYLGDTFDLHTGGVDHIPVHHENEIAQSEALLGKKAVNYWMHGEFMMVNNGKMSKSLKNTYTVADLREKGIDPLAFRYMCLNAHYRNKLNFTWKVMASAEISYKRLLEAVLANKNAPSDNATKVEAAKALMEFKEAVLDDLNIPKALGILWTMLRNGNKSMEIYTTATEMDKILGIDLDKCEQKLLLEQSKEEDEIPKELNLLLEQRTEARKNKNWALSDQIRDQLNAAGYDIEDSKEGSRLKKK